MPTHGIQILFHSTNRKEPLAFEIEHPTNHPSLAITYDVLKKLAFGTLAVQLYKISETKYNRAIRLLINVFGLSKDCSIHSQISSAPSACSMQNTIQSPIFDRSGVKCRIRSSRRSRCLQMNKVRYKLKRIELTHSPEWWDLRF